MAQKNPPKKLSISSKPTRNTNVKPSVKTSSTKEPSSPDSIDNSSNKSLILVWLDPNVNESKNEDETSMNLLRRVIHKLKIFNNSNRCIDFLIETKDETIFIIVSSILAQTIVPHLQPMSKIYAIYILHGENLAHKCETLVKEYNKVKGIFNKIEMISKTIQENVQIYTENLTPISILKSTDSSNKKLDELDPSFMYSQLLKEILLEIKFDENAKQEFIKFCRKKYQNNKFELKVIDEFETNYEQHSPIWWYTRECFIYSMLNQALRLQDIDIILRMGFFVRDLHRQIEEIHLKAKTEQSLIVFRGQRLLNRDFEKLRNSRGGLISFNNFLSTSADRNVSLIYARSTVTTAEFVAILFQMEIDSQLSSTPFAPVNTFGYYSNKEKEILLSMHAVFRIGDIKEMENNLWEIKLKLTADKDQQLKSLSERLKKEIGSGTGWHQLSQLMIKMGQFNKAKDISQVLLSTASSNDYRTIATCHHQLGYVDEEQGDLSNALIHYKTSLDNSLLYLSANDAALASTYSNIGSVYKKQGDLNAALDYFQRALTIDLQSSHPDQLQIAGHYNNIGLVLKLLDKSDEALNNYELSLEKKLAHLPPFHPSLAIAYSNISGIYQSKKDYSKALLYLEKTLEIKEKSLPSNHPSLIVTYRNMATALDGLRRLEEAVQHAQKAVHIAQHAFGSDHPEFRDHQQYLDELRQKMTR